MANVNEKILTTAKNNLDALGNTLGKKVGAAIKSDAKNATNLNAKDLFTTTGTMKIPEAVYNAVAKAISDNVPKSIYTKYSENEGELIKQVSTQVGKLLSSIDEFPVSVKEGGKTVTYTVKFNGSKLGVNGGFISVSKGKQTSWLNWKNESTGKTAMAQYCVSLHNLGKEATNAKTLLASILVENGAKIFSAIFGNDESLFKKILGNESFKTVSKEYGVSQVEKVFTGVANKTISKAVTQYKNLTTDYKNLESEIHSSTATVKSIKTKSSTFTSDAKKVQSSLKSLGINVSLSTLPTPVTPPLELQYDKNNTAVTVPAGYTSELKASDYKSSVKTIYAGNFTTAITINGNAKDNVITSGTKNDSLIGGKGKDKLVGNAGDDTLTGGFGNDTLTGGAGKDIFIYANGDGADVITDYTAGQDKIKLTSGSISKVGMNGKDVTFTIGKGSIKVQDVKDKVITVVLPSKKESKYLNGKLVSGGENSTVNSTTLTVTNSMKSPLKVGSEVKVIDASKCTKAIKITGNALDNKISGGKKDDTLLGEKGKDSLVGNAGNDTLYGGVGNDTITGGAGKDIFCYANGDGTDLITDYTTEQDKIKLTSGSISKVTMNSNDAVFTIGKGSIKVQDAKDKEITVILADGSEQTYLNGRLISVEDDGGGILNTSGITVTLPPDHVGTFSLTTYNKNSTSKAVNIDARECKSHTRIYGDDEANYICGGTNNDYLSGGKSDDTLHGGDGNDHIEGGWGNDLIFGGAGNDYLLGNNNGNNTIDGGIGDDLIYGSYYDDSLLGGKGDDTINGGQGNDILVGGDGNDLLDCDSGNDTLTGGKGNDTFIFNWGHDSGIITDYTTDEDKIKVSNGKISQVNVNGYNVTFLITQTGKGDKGSTLTVQNAKGKVITVVDRYDNTSYYKDGVLLSNSSNLAASADAIDDYWFEDKTCTSAELDSLMNELHSTNNSVSELLTDYAENPNKLLSNVTFTPTTRKK